LQPFKGRHILSDSDSHAIGVFLLSFGKSGAHLVLARPDSLAGLLAKIRKCASPLLMLSTLITSMVPSALRSPDSVGSCKKRESLGPQPIPALQSGVWEHERRCVFLDALKRFVKGVLGRFFGHPAAKFKQVFLIGHIQVGIQRVQARVFFLAVVPGALYRDGAENRPSSPL
jgi:hypothetical protein